MSLFTTMNTAASGLGVSSGSLEVIGDNIANMNTIGYKGTRAEFADYLPQDVFGLAGPSQIGKGAGMNTLQTMFGQGSFDTSQNPLDMAISGDGFFMVSDGVQDFYTRNGQFYLDSAGTVVNAQGYALQGYTVDANGTLGATVGDLVIDLDPVAPAATTGIELTAILSADTVPTGNLTALVAATPFDGTAAAPTLEDAASTADFATSVTVYDSLGVAHEVTVLFERDPAAPDTWNWYAVVDGGEAGGDPGFALEIASGTLQVDADGNPIAFTEATTAAPFDSAAAQTINFDFGIDAAGNPTEGRVRMLAGESAVSGVAQDGYPPGDLSSLSVDKDGIVTGRYSNGEELVLGQVVLAAFDANAELERVGNTLFRETIGSGSPAVGAPDSGGRGRVAGNALEQSNVDLEREFVTMITAQRTYQANARMIDTANSTLQELVQLV